MVPGWLLSQWEFKLGEQKTGWSQRAVVKEQHQEQEVASTWILKHLLNIPCGVSHTTFIVEVQSFSFMMLLHYYFSEPY